ncbi:MAG: hypothetical protein HY222_06195 [Thaumarchaeota archaeon]|nr:hypothetical protein [Nitrososphaerota archaeon]MBI3641967.1 hypothetical protein [Nitrososphaerota archaeon]
MPDKVNGDTPGGQIQWQPKDTPKGNKPSDEEPKKSCDSNSCIDAKNKIIKDGNDVTYWCGQENDAKSAFNSWIILFGILVSAGLVFLTLAYQFPDPTGSINATLLIIALIFFAVALFAGIMAGIAYAQWQDAMDKHKKASQDFMADVQIVLDNCPDSCQGDLHLPTCS